MYHEQKSGVNHRYLYQKLLHLATFLPEQFIFNKQLLICPFYHGISNESLPYISPIYPLINTKTFEKELEQFLKKFEPISLDELLDSNSIFTRNKKPKLLLSFDDGLSSCYDYIAPLLLQKGIPAIFFVNSAFVDNQDLMFRYKAAILCSKMGSKKALEISYANRNLLEEWALELEIDFKQLAISQKPYMNGEQILDLSAKGFEIGAHSDSHPLFCEIDESQQWLEIERSVNFVKNLTQKTCRTFAFPFHDQGVGIGLMEKAVNELGLSYFFGSSAFKKEPYPRLIQRFPMENQLVSGITLIKRNLWSAKIKTLLGMNLIKREK